MFHQRLSPQHPYRATVGQQALRRQAINKSGIIMKPNESPSIFPKQAGDSQSCAGGGDAACVCEDEPRDEQKPNVVLMLNVSHGETCNTRAAVLSDTSMTAYKCVCGWPQTRKTYYSIL